MDKDKVLEIANKFIQVIDIRCDEIDRISIRADAFFNFAAAIETAVREECAKVCDEVWRESIGIAGASARTAAEAIRNMGKEG